MPVLLYSLMIAASLPGFVLTIIYIRRNIRMDGEARLQRKLLERLEEKNGDQTL